MECVAPAWLVCRCLFTHEANSSPEHCTKKPRYLFYSHCSLPSRLSLWFCESLGRCHRWRAEWDSPASSLRCQGFQQANLECQWYLQLDCRHRSLSYGETVLHSPNSKFNTVKTKTHISRSTRKAFSNLQLQELCSGKLLDIYPHILRGQVVYMT